MSFFARLALIGAVILSAISLASGQSGTVVPEDNAHQKTNLVNAQIERERAQAEFYRERTKSLSDKGNANSLMQSIANNPGALLAAIGAALAASVAFISFLFNYLATVRNQRDMQFYEALKRLGDKDSPTVRSSAVGVLLKMADVKTRGLLMRRERPYFDISRDHLATALLLEDNRVALFTIRDALRRIVTIDAHSSLLMLYNTNLKLQDDMGASLVDFFVGSKAGSFDNITSQLWEQAAALTQYEPADLKHICNRKERRLKARLEAKVALFGTMEQQRQAEYLATAQSSIDIAAFRFGLVNNTFSFALTERRKTDDSILNAEKVFFAKQDLQGANLKGADLRVAYLSGAKLQSADLSLAQMQNACLRNADLTDARLWRSQIGDCTDLQGANWWKASFYEREGGESDSSLFDLLRRRYPDALPKDPSSIHSSIQGLLKRAGSQK